MRGTPDEFFCPYEVGVHQLVELIPMDALSFGGQVQPHADASSHRT